MHHSAAWRRRIAMAGGGGRPGGLTSEQDNQQLVSVNCEKSCVDKIGKNQGPANRSTGLQNENPGALAGATGAFDIREWLTWIDHSLKRESQARGLCHAVMNCAHADRLPFLEAILQGLRAGMPIAAFGQIMREANFWAENASRAEKKAYCAAAFAHMPPEDQDAFRAFISQERAAA